MMEIFFTLAERPLSIAITKVIANCKVELNNFAVSTADKTVVGGKRQEKWSFQCALRSSPVTKPYRLC